MSLQVPIDIKAALMSVAALGGRIGLDEKRENEVYPNVTMVPDVSVTSALRGDQRTIARLRQGQIDLWQTQVDEDDALLEAVLYAVDGMALTKPGLRLQVLNWVRTVDPDFDVIHHAITYSAAALVPARVYSLTVGGSVAPEGLVG